MVPLRTEIFSCNRLSVGEGIVTFAAKPSGRGKRECHMSDRTKQQEEFEALFRKNYARLYRYALDFLEDEEAAKDVVSELFGDLWKQYDAWRPDSPEAYLNRALRNRCLNYLKHRAVERNALQGYINEKMSLIDNDVAVHEERMKQVERIMDTLPVRTRFILEQCYIEKKKYSEMAEALDTSVGMIHKHISKALAIFRKALGENSLKGGTES